MILQLLLVLAASRLTQAGFEACPEDSACLYHARCHKPSLTGEVVLATTNPKDYKTWKRANCSGHTTVVELFVRPLSKHKWNLTLTYPIDELGINFGSSLTMMANETEASFTPEDTSIMIPFEKMDSGDILFTVEYYKERLLEIFSYSEIGYIEEGMHNGSISSEQPLFWEKIHELTPCDPSLIFDDCTTSAKNCSALNLKRDSADCQEEANMWLMLTNYKWQQLDSVGCHNETKNWELLDINGTLVATEKIEIRCAAEEPEPWKTSVATSLQANEQATRDTEKKKEEEPFNLMDSPFTWVGIGLVGLIVLAAVALAIVYAYRKLGKNTPLAKSSKSKTGFTRLSQEPPSGTGMTSGSNSEADVRNAEPTPPPASSVPTQTPQEAAPVSRADAPTADTVNRLSMIKTIEDDSKIAPIPGPPPN